MRTNEMANDSTSLQPFLIEDLDKLRSKLQHARGSLARKWAHFQSLAAHQDAALPLYPAFVGLLTRDATAVTSFRHHLEKKIEAWPSLTRTVHIQYHVYCSAISLVRFAIAYDWVADHPAMRDFDLKRMADTILDTLYGHVYPLMKSREPASNNQIASMILSCLMAGYLFGERHGRDPRARFLMQYALERMHELTDWAEPWFVGEGSTYIEAVNVPVSAWFDQVIGWLGISGDRETWRGCRKLGWGLIGPGGLSLPWDHYGYQRSFGMAGLALLARETGDGAPLAAIDHLNLWHGIDYGAWGEDMRIWTLIWWPDHAPDWPAEDISLGKAIPSWAHARIGAALHEPDKRLRVFQCWDLCHGDTSGGHARCQTDPCSISMDLDGIPLILDGFPTPECAAFNYDPHQMLAPSEIEDIQRGLKFHSAVVGKELDLSARVKEFSYGCVGGANALVFEQQPWHFPRGRVEGRGTLWCQLQGLQAVSADCTGHYSQRYPVRRVERTTLLIDGDYVVTLDQIESEKPLAASWQVYACPDAKKMDRLVKVRTPQGPSLSLLPEDASTLNLEPCPGFPCHPNTGSARVSWSWKTDGRMRATLLYPENGRLIGTVEDSWEGGFLPAPPLQTGLDGEDFSEVPKEQFLHPCAKGTWREVVEALAAAPPERFRWFRLRAVVPSDATMLRLLVPAQPARVWLNGHPLARPYGPMESALILPYSIRVTVGQNIEILVVMRPDRGQLLVEPGRWYADAQERSLLLRHMNDGNHWSIFREDGRGPPPVVEIMDAAAARQQGIATDARFLLRMANGHVYVLHATRVMIGGLQPLDGGAPVHAHWDGRLWNTTDVCVPGSVTKNPDPHPAVRFKFSGEPVGIAPSASPGARVAAVFQENKIEALIGYLQDEDFRVRMTAAERLGNTGSREAVPALSRLLAKELAQDLYPTVPQAVEARSWEDEMLAVGKVAGVARYRVVQSALMALLQLNAPMAAEFARGMLQDLRHFYPVHHLACKTLGVLGTEKDVALLEQWLHYPEVNTQMAAKEAIARLRQRQ
ncbi:MAG: HEAT repeat domain-containing protein [Verrucomicrobia bacterium]|nr:HEAT repeat domain-containing protein [Verrucomicrobiota bacterium]